jgi:hypothetical protein
MRVYIASVYTKGDVAINVRNAILIADELVKLGHTPYIPHLTHFWHLFSPKEVRFWYEYDNSFLDHWAECVLRLPNESHGADQEVVRACTIRVPVYYTLAELEGCGGEQQKSGRTA